MKKLSESQLQTLEEYKAWLYEKSQRGRLIEYLEEIESIDEYIKERGKAWEISLEIRNNYEELQQEAFNKAAKAHCKCGCEVSLVVAPSPIVDVHTLKCSCGYEEDVTLYEMG